MNVRGIEGPSVIRVVTESPGAGVIESEAPKACNPVPGVTTMSMLSDIDGSRMTVVLAERLDSDSVESKLNTMVKGKRRLVNEADVSRMGKADDAGDAKLTFKRPTLPNDV